MKKYLLILACACFTFAACDELGLGGNKDDETPGLDELPTIGGENQEPTEELTPAQQQAKFQSVGQEILAEFPAEKFQNFADIAEAFDETYGTVDYDFSELEAWAENAESVTYSHNHQYEYENNGVGFCKKNWLILLSNYTGLFTFGASKVTVAPYEGTKAVFTVKGKTYEAEITSSGEVMNAYFEYTYHDENRYDYDNNGDGLINDDDNYVWDWETKVTLGVPENINVSISENGTPLATVSAKFSLNVTSDEVQFSTDAFATEFTVMINGYELKVSKTGYEGPASKAQMLATLSNGSKTLLTYTMSADLHLKTDTLSGTESHYSWTSKEVVVEKFENFKAAMDILGQIQVIGTCKDINKVNDEIDKVYDALRDYDYEAGVSKPVDEATAAQHTEEVNKLIDFGVYYDNGSNKQADIKFEYYYETYEHEWGSGTAWGFNPIIIFNDGSQNKIEDFFTENAFNGLMESLEDFAESYETVFGYFFAKEEEITPAE